MSMLSFCPRTAGLLNALPMEYFPLTYDLNSLKGYLCYKTTTSHNVSPEAQVKNSKKIMFCFHSDFSSLSDPIILQTWPIDRYKQSKYFSQKL